MKSLRQRIQERGHALNIYCQVASPLIAEQLAHEGFDAITLDLQHGLIGYADAVAMLTALAGADVIPMVRTPALDSALVMKLLDAGTLGITCASVDSAEQAHQLVQATRYPPRGARSFGPVRASILHAEYLQRSDELVNVYAMIESAAALSQLDEIVSTPGIDGVYIGPLDLALSMGEPVPVPGGTLSARVEQAVDRIVRCARDRGRVAGMLASDGDAARRLLQRGVQFITLASDLTAVRVAVRQWRRQFDGPASPAQGPARSD